MGKPYVVDFFVGFTVYNQYFGCVIDNYDFIEENLESYDLVEKIIWIILDLTFLIANTQKCVKKLLKLRKTSIKTLKTYTFCKKRQKI